MIHGAVRRIPNDKTVQNLINVKPLGKKKLLKVWRKYLCVNCVMKAWANFSRYSNHQNACLAAATIQYFQTPEIVQLKASLAEPKKRQTFQQNLTTDRFYLPMTELHRP